uniref:CSON002264 protein n=1 Tax=Culicoides sonorensis TaxID=179676 RepID=A0A336LRM8_CULSO
MMQNLAILADVQEINHNKIDKGLCNDTNSHVSINSNKKSQKENKINSLKENDVFKKCQNEQYGNKSFDGEDYEYEKLRQLCSYDDAPVHLKHNPYIRDGYRKELPTVLCIESIFWWTNETINIWSHLFGWILFLCISYTDIKFLSEHASYVDKIIVGCLLFCFQMCLILSTVYHTFSCRSAKDYSCFLSFDLFGIALSLLAIFISGIYYAFWCQNTLRNFYVFSVCIIFTAAMILQLPWLNIDDNVKMVALLGWAIYGIVPTCHWYFEMGGTESQMVQLFIPRVIGMYLLTGIAFLIYAARIPERWFVGKMDYFGHSHNWWHFLVLLALYYWHNSGIFFLDYRLTHGCSIMKNSSIYY